jgi:hypothetical protein
MWIKGQSITPQAKTTGFNTSGGSYRMQNDSNYYLDRRVLTKGVENEGNLTAVDHSRSHEANEAEKSPNLINVVTSFNVQLEDKHFTTDVRNIV